MFIYNIDMRSSSENMFLIQRKRKPKFIAICRIGNELAKLLVYLGTGAYLFHKLYVKLSYM